MKIEQSVVVKAPIDKVFAVFSDLDQAEMNIEGITKLEIIEGPAKMAIGTKWRETREMFGKEATEVMWVTALKENDIYEVHAASHGSKYTSIYTFEEAEEGTNVTLTFTGKAVSIGAKLMTPLFFIFKGSTKKAFLADMTTLKKVAEK